MVPSAGGWVCQQAGGYGLEVGCIIRALRLRARNGEMIAHSSRSAPSMWPRVRDPGPQGPNPRAGYHITRYVLRGTGTRGWD